MSLYGDAARTRKTPRPGGLPPRSRPGLGFRWGLVPDGAKSVLSRVPGHRNSELPGRFSSTNTETETAVQDRTRLQPRVRRSGSTSWSMHLTETAPEENYTSQNPLRRVPAPWPGFQQKAGLQSRSFVG